MGRSTAFRWIQWNVDKVLKHGVTPDEAESVVRNARHGQTVKGVGGKMIVQSRGQGGRLVQVVYVPDDDGTFFIIHAMPLTARKRRRKK